MWEVAWGCRGGRADAHRRWAMCCGGQRCWYVVVVGQRSHVTVCDIGMLMLQQAREIT